MQLLQYTDALPGGSGQWNSCNTLPHRLGAVDSATSAMQCFTALGAVGNGSSAMHCPTAWGQWAVEPVQCTSSPGVTVSILGIRRAKLDVLHATDHPSQQSRRYGVLPGHSASQAGCASRHVTPITVVQAVRCPSRAFGEPSRILLHNPHVTAVPVVNWQGQDEMCCPVCCSLVTGCCLGQGWAFRCAGAYFIMFHYDQLSQQEQADALLPAHVFPVTGFGTLPETDVVPMVRVFAADRCTTCGRPRAAQVIVVAAPRPGCHSPRAICTCLPPGAQPVDKQLAARTSLRAGIQLLEHVVLVSSRFLPSCAPVCEPAPPMPSWLRVLTRRLDRLDDRMNGTSTVHSAFRQATLNCGGAGDPAVLEAVTVLICALDPDVVCLQELWDADPRVQVALAPFVFVASSEAGRGRGMWVLVHRRLQLAGPPKVPFDWRSWMTVVCDFHDQESLLVFNLPPPPLAKSPPLQSPPPPRETVTSMFF